MLATLQKWNRRWNRTFRAYSHERAPNCAQAAYKNQHVSVLVKLTHIPPGMKVGPSFGIPGTPSFAAVKPRAGGQTLQPLHYIRVTRRVMRQAVAAYGVCGVWCKIAESNRAEREVSNLPLTLKVAQL